MSYPHQEESIFIHIDENLYDEMVNEGFSWPHIETGGMLFGNLVQKDNRIIIEILKTYIPSEDNCIRKSTYFEINPEYAKAILSQEDLLYLGNWHKHPGYGGPSYGDLGQIDDFFMNNPHLNIILAFILNFKSEQEIESIIEVYFRDNVSSTENRPFLTRRIPQSNLTLTNDKSVQVKSAIEGKGVPHDILSKIKAELVNIFDHLSSIEDIQEFPGQIRDEKVLAFPYQFRIQYLDQPVIIDSLILISFPPEFPNGKIFFDISSEDMSKDITFNTHPAETLNDEELIHPFLLLLKTDLEDEIPLMLKQPLWQIMKKEL